MNFLSHYYIDRTYEDSLFFLGVSTPDLASLFRRDCRIRPHMLPPAPSREEDPLMHSFHQGVSRHFEADALFHSCDFFFKETHDISQRIRETIPDSGKSRPSFIAHIALELILDRILISHHADLIPNYYGHFLAVNPEVTARLTERAMGRKLDGYPNFLKSFVARKSLYHYQEWERTLFILSKIVEGVRLPGEFIRHNLAFRELLEAYEADLAPRAEAELLTLAGQLKPL